MMSLAKKLNQQIERGVKGLPAPNVTVDNEVAAGIAANLQQITQQLAHSQEQMLMAMAELLRRCDDTLQACAKALDSVADKSVSVSVEPAEITLNNNPITEIRMESDGDGGYVAEIIRD